VAILSPAFVGGRGNFDLLHQNLYRCARIYTVFRKVDAFVRTRVKPAFPPHTFFTSSKNKTLL